MAPRRVNALLALLVVFLTAALGLLATLQYRWIDRISEAERQRMTASLDLSVRRFVQDVERELAPIEDAFSGPGAEDLAAAWERWREAAPDPELVRDVFLAHAEPAGLRLVQLDFGTGALEPAAWPQDLAPLRERLAARFRGPGFRGGGPPSASVDGMPLLVLPRRSREPLGGFGMPAPRGPGELVIVRLDAGRLTGGVIPRLVERHFAVGSGGTFDVALAAGDRVVYRSDPAFPGASAPPESTFPLLRDPEGPAPGEPPGGPPGFGRPRARAIPPDWKLLVRRRDGGLEEIVGSAKRRNLFVSFGVLAILAATLVTLLALLRRTSRLHAQQTEFVAAMSHELNTPVAALRAAGENLRDRIVSDPERVARYGESIVRESTRLGDLLGQIMEFAGMQARGRSRRSEERVDVNRAVEEAVAQCRWLAEAEGVEVKIDADAALPSVLGDPAALARAVQNLLANAIRHGGSGRWASVSTRRHGGRVSIRVEDRGPGIDRRDLARLFEPFYRGRAAAARGAGLGLAIVRRVAEEHHGSVRAESTTGGAAFTIELPAAEG